MLSKSDILKSLEWLSKMNGWEDFSDEIIMALYDRHKNQSVDRWSRIIKRVASKCKFRPTFADFFSAEEWVKEYGWH